GRDGPDRRNDDRHPVAALRIGPVDRRFHGTPRFESSSGTRLLGSAVETSCRSLGAPPVTRSIRRGTSRATQPRVTLPGLTGIILEPALAAPLPCTQERAGHR